MEKTDDYFFEEIEKVIEKYEWFPFGDFDKECPDIDEQLRIYAETNKLPSPCDNCYKALVHWDGNYSKKNIINFVLMMNNSNIRRTGKFNRRCAVIYFKDKDVMFEYLRQLKFFMNKNKVIGTIDWRRACESFQKSRPELWVNAKEFR